MKKNLSFIVLLALVTVILFMLRITGMGAHIVVSIAGLLVLVIYALATKKEWKSPALEILMRVFYAIAFITGVVLMKVHGVAAIGIAHKISAALFAVLLIVSVIHKAVKK